MADLAAQMRRRSADGPLTVAVWLSVVAVIPPFLRVVDSGPWTIGVAALVAVLLGIGYLARRRGLPAIAVTLLELGAWVLVLTAVFFRETAFLWAIPTPDTVDAVRLAVGEAATEIQNGAAPLPAGAAMSLLLIGGMGLLAVVVDHTVLSARLPLLAAVGLIAVTLVPPVVVPGPVDVVAFVLLGVAILVMVRAETRGRQRAMRTRTSSGAPVSVAAFGIAAVALVVALVVAPLLPQPGVVGAFSTGPGATISASLALGDDLRRPREVQVLTEWTSQSDAPYLRAATLTDFDGSVWKPDQYSGVPIAQAGALGDVPVADGIKVDTVTTSVQIENLASPWLPVSSPAVSVDGLQGSGWLGVAYNRTVISGESDTQKQSYTVTSQVPRPTLEQIRALRTGSADEVPAQTLAVPGDMPAEIADLAQQVTGGAATPYDKLVALQDWFRGPDFTYSLDAPVQDGFDGSGVQAIAEFLQAKSGYCIHFASSFALMARTLGMPSRIVVGYLPGQPTTNDVDKQTVYAVSSGQLHAWPEVYFDGVGWVPFEPTKSLGVATAFSATATNPSDPEPSQVTTAPTATARPDAPDLADEPEGTTDASRATTTALGPGLWVVLAVLLLLLVPATVRAVQRRVSIAAARGGDAVAAWHEARATALDLGLDVSASDSPRALGRRLVAAGAPAAAVTVLVDAIERASYAPDAAVPTGPDAPPDAAAAGDALAEAVRAVRHGVLAAADRRHALLAVVAPRSLVRRPAASVPTG